MELIIKPTGRCNFNCKFCSASNMNIHHPVDNKVPEKIANLIKENEPNCIIVTGGEPLMVDPDYYYDLHSISNVGISITSNLKDFYINPEKWVKLFNEEWFNITTSFNYGNGRMWDSKTVYTEDLFLKVLDKFKKYINKPIPTFIAVIDYDNESTVFDHVYLAKKLGTCVKLNNAIGVGKQSVSYPRYKMYRHYLDILKEGLGDYEINCLERNTPKCPKNINMLCESVIRCCYINNEGDLKVGTCDEQVAFGNFLSDEKISCKTVIPTKINIKDFIKPECAYCELFRLCNGCNTNRHIAKLDPNYCIEMKKLEQEIIDAGWKL